MVSLLGFTLNPWSKPTWFNCLGAWHIAYFTIVHLICAKVQIVDNFSWISHSKMILTFMWCHLSTGIFYSKINEHDSYKYSILVCTNLGRGYSTSWMLRLTPFQAYHMCSSLIVRKMESLELNIIFQISTTYCKWYKSNWFPHVVFLNQYHHVDFTLYLYAFSMYYID